MEGEEEELEEGTKKEEELEEGSHEKKEELEEDFDLSEILAELDNEEELEEAKKEDKEEEESEDESKEESEEKGEEDDKKVTDLSVEELKSIIKDIVDQELESEEYETPSDEEMEQGDEQSLDLGNEEPVAGEEQPLGGEEAGSEDEIDLEELLAELDALDESEEELEEGKGKVKVQQMEKPGDKYTPVKKIKEELDLAVSTIKTLRKELNEVNLLNAKLLYVNKIFKAKNLTESQKLKVITSFDKATNVKEAKVVFESLNSTLVSPKKAAIKESMGFASKAVGVASKPAIVESDNVISRMQRLANIK
jgi:hypothetical protein